MTHSLGPRPRRRRLSSSLFFVAGLFAMLTGTACRKTPPKPRHEQISWRQRRAVDGELLLKPQKSFYAEYEPERTDLERALRERLPMHMPEINVKSREAFGMDAVALSEKVKSLLLGEREWFRKTFQRDGWKVKAILVKSRAPAFALDDYGLSVNLQVQLYGLWENLPYNLVLPISALFDGTRLVRVNSDVNPDGKMLDEVLQGERLRDFSQRWHRGFLKSVRNDVDQYLRVVLTEGLAVDAGAAPEANLVSCKRYIPLSKFRVAATADFDGDGVADDKIRIVNRRLQVPDKDEVWFKDYQGFDLWINGERVYGSHEDRVKFLTLADMDGDRKSDMVLVVDKARPSRFVGPRRFATAEHVVSRLYYVDGQDLARRNFRLGPVRFLLEKACMKAEVRDLTFAPNYQKGRFRDWDLRFHLFDHEAKARIEELVVDKFVADEGKWYFRGLQKTLF